MGAKNHQPCSRYLEHSTKVSKDISLMQISLWQSNVFLEDELLKNLKKEKFSVVESIKAIDLTIEYAKRIKSSLLNLIEQLEKNDFQELPETNEVLQIIGRELKNKAYLNFNEKQLKLSIMF